MTWQSYASQHHQYFISTFDSKNMYWDFQYQFKLQRETAAVQILIMQTYSSNICIVQTKTAYYSLAI